jgi:protein-disulfide isomerase
MGSVRALGLAALLAFPPEAAVAEDVPCGAVKTPSLAPCDAPKTAADAERERRLAAVAAAVGDARRAALDAEISDVRLHLEAERRGLAFRDFWEAEVLGKTPPASDADLAAAFEQAKTWYPGKTAADLRPLLESVVLAGNRARREAELAASLKEAYPLVPGADPNAPVLSPGAVLATVGSRRITAASAGASLDVAGFAVRRDLHYDAAEGAEKPPLPESPVQALDLAGAAARGPSNAPVTVVEYADFECPHCSKAWEAAEEALKPYGGVVRYAFHNFPLPNHERAQKAAEAARAADAQGRFFEMARLMFRNQKALDDAALKRYAAEAGCDPARFAADLDSRRFRTDVLLEVRAGGRAGVDGTPTFFVNGRWLPWEAADVAGIRAAVDAALVKAGVAPAAPKAAPAP